MTLRTSLTSPFGRKVRMAAHVLGLSDAISLAHADTLDEADTLRRQNPLGKMPCLILGDGTVIFDSRVIIEYLDTLAERPSMLPLAGLERFRLLTRATLFDGVADAALLMVYERRFRRAEQVSERWLDHQRGKALRGLAAAQEALPDARRTDLASISLACALGYLDWRRPLEWRGEFPRLADWLAAFAENEPAFAATQRPEEQVA